MSVFLAKLFLFLSLVQHIALAIFFPAWLRLSSFCVRRVEKFAQERKQQIEERMAQCQKKQEDKHK